MNRLSPEPLTLPLRVLLLCLVLASVMLWRDGGSFTEILMLAGGVLSPEPGGAPALRLLLGKCATTFFLISLALVTGLGVALAVTMGTSHFGGAVMRWVRRAGWLVSVLPPVALALGSIYFLIRVRELPVETLFPFQPAPESDSLVLRAGRLVWSWLVPALVLAVPVAGCGVAALTRRLDDLHDDENFDRLRARGLDSGHLLYRHQFPLLRTHLIRVAGPLAVLLLAFDVPVEELLAFDGWGRFAAQQLLASGVTGRVLAVIFWMGALVLVCVLGCLALVPARTLPGHEKKFGRVLPPTSAGEAICGMVLALVLMIPWRWVLSESLLPRLIPSIEAWTFEVARALGLGLASVVVVVAASFLVSLTRGKIPGRGWCAALALVPMPAALLFWEKTGGRSAGLIMLVVAAPGISRMSAAWHDAETDGYLDASRSMGQRGAGLWRVHVLSELPRLLPLMLMRHATMVLQLMCVLDFYLGSENTWGGLMRRNADRVLDDPLPVLAPGLLLVLWSLSFRLISRASPDHFLKPRPAHSEPR